ncbi:hypothetical protein UlMin_026397 [Ulmus minor]
MASAVDNTEGETPKQEKNSSSQSPPEEQNHVKPQNQGNVLGSYCSVKLNHENYLLWKSMVLPVIRGNRLDGFIKGTKECPPEFIIKEDSGFEEVHLNPDYENWIAQDQTLLGWLYNSIDVEVAYEVMGNESSEDLWKALETLFGTMKKLADNLALAGQPIGIDDLVSQVLAGLDSLEYNPVVCQINEKEHVTWMELQSILLSYERRLEQITGGVAGISIGQATANFVSAKGPGGYQNKTQHQGSGQGHNGHQSNGGNRYHGSNINRGGGRSRGRGGRFN